MTLSLPLPPRLFITSIIIMSSFLTAIASSGTREHTTKPMVTGGVLLAADTLLSYGTMAKHSDARRLHAIHDTVVVGASGEYSDACQVIELLQQESLKDTRASLFDDIYSDKARNSESTWHYLRMLFYERRNKMNPYWNDMLVSGYDHKHQPFLGMVDKIGTTVRDNVLATGFGAYLALPLLREHWRPDLSEGEARALLEDAMKILFYRDCRASPRITMSKCSWNQESNKVDVLVSEPYTLETQWDGQDFVRPVAGLEGDGGW
jgi:20S proteasome subunit beta 7